MKTVSIAFITLTIISFSLLIKFLFEAITKTNLEPARKNKLRITLIVSLLAWALFVSIWSISGKMSNFNLFPLNMMPVLIVPMVVILIFIFSKSTQPVIARLSQTKISALQSFRVLVEILLWRLFILNEMPVQMSFEGRNWDVLTGLTAILVAYLLGKGKISKTALIAWNLSGLALLLNILTIAILSMPTTFRVFMNEPSNTIVTQFPISLLPGFLVPLAYGLHFISLRKLSISKSQPN